MRTLLRALLFLGLVAGLLVAASWMGWWLFGGAGPVVLTIDDSGITLPMSAGPWAANWVGVLVAAVVAVVVVPLALLVGLGVPALVLTLVLGLVLLVVFGVAAVVCAPLLLPVLLVVWLLRRDRRAMRRASTTIAG
jgi:hypothetical protein